MTPSEQLVFDLCSRTALSLWSYASPRRSDGRELCDVLVVFGPHIIIFSVKEVTLSEKSDPSIAADRWIKKAVNASIQQLAGANRELTSMQRVVRHDGLPGVALPLAQDRKMHFVAVAAGGRRKVPFGGGVEDFGKVHVMDEVALRAILGELDTISDLVEYLEVKEAFHGTIICEGEENLLAVYLHRRRKLPSDMHSMIVEDGLWSEICAKPEFIARKFEDQVSYTWDRLIETVIRNSDVALEAGLSQDQYEMVARTMAAESRFQRRLLGFSFISLLEKKQSLTRFVKSESGVGYVFGIYPGDYAREQRTANLGIRCFVARSPLVFGCETIIGIATEVYDPSGYSLDVIYQHLPEWTNADEEKALELKQQLGILSEPTVWHVSMDEFPAVDKNGKAGGAK